jgi:hypothetical protein
VPGTDSGRSMIGQNGRAYGRKGGKVFARADYTAFRKCGGSVPENLELRNGPVFAKRDLGSANNVEPPSSGYLFGKVSGVGLGRVIFFTFGPRIAEHVRHRCERRDGMSSRIDGTLQCGKDWQTVAPHEKVHLVRLGKTTRMVTCCVWHSFHSNYCSRNRPTAKPPRVLYTATVAECF